MSVLGVKLISFVKGDKKKKETLEYDGSFVMCVLGEIQEQNDVGLICKESGSTLAMSKIVDGFSGAQCPQLLGKPKFFFFLDQGTEKDCGKREQIHV
jgi:hypothetical protein